ncbi:MAG: WbqC family protein [Limnohabitans sp.]
MTILIGHQPLFVGSAEWWSRLAAADVFVINDHVDYEPKSAQNRHRIDGVVWTVPVVHAGKPLPIRQTPIAVNDPLIRKLGRAVPMMWPKQPYRDDALRILLTALDGPHPTLGDVTLHMIRSVHAYLGLHSELVVGSLLNDRCTVPLQRGTILGQCLVANADQYWCGISGRDYLPLAEYRSAGVQVWEVGYEGEDGGVPVLDLIARHGRAAREKLGRTVPVERLA